AAARSVPAPRAATARAAAASRFLLGLARVRGPLRLARGPALLPRPEASGGQADGLRRLAAQPRGRADDCLQQRERRRELRRRVLSGLDRGLRLPRLVARGSTLPPGCGRDPGADGARRAGRTGDADLPRRTDLAPPCADHGWPLRRPADEQWETCLPEPARQRPRIASELVPH